MMCLLALSAEFLAPSLILLQTPVFAHGIFCSLVASLAEKVIGPGPRLHGSRSKVIKEIIE